MTIRILIVDDSLPMRAVIQKTIKASGYASAEFFQAGNGREALDVMKEEWVDIVITDYNMPDMNGLELIAAMKADAEMQSVPALMVTTEGSQEKIDQFIAKGAAGYIKKPFTPEEIRDKLIEILGEMRDDADVEDSDNELDF